MLRWIAYFLVFAMSCGSALSQQEIKFPAVPSTRVPYSGEVETILTLPAKAAEKVPAVVIIHSRGGYDAAHSELYAAPLRQAGIATLNLILARYPMRSFSTTDFLPHAFGALKYLLSHPRIDPNKIGIMGMSLGGIVAMYTASEMLASEHMGTAPARFAAHAPLYPVCFIHENIIRVVGSQKRLANAYAKLTGAPVLILAGGKDQYDDPDSCQRFVAALPAEARQYVELTFYPDATHGWDQGRNARSYDRAACKARGCEVEYVSDPATTAKGRDAVVEFFSSKLVSATGK